MSEISCAFSDFCDGFDEGLASDSGYTVNTLRAFSCSQPIGVLPCRQYAVY
ncbi:hypothetical protein [Pseudorhodobacter antarcticus]|uniref:hypothetical protein n=1 Tax=Pseudorhodobacter antarcticus TaxID=1077947 RepID=UPI001587D12E|nr:hypothetical protein [Pseudorhodobacter antarcticus]